MVSYIKAIVNGIVVSNVLILIVVEDGLVQILQQIMVLIIWMVLILIVVEDGLVQVLTSQQIDKYRLNPYCSGRWSRTYGCYYS